MPYINPGVRAKAAWLEGFRTNKYGKRIPSKDHLVAAKGGSFSAKEMEREMREIAKEEGYPESAIRIETYPLGDPEAQTANPRHRGSLKRKFYSGWSPPER